MKGLTAWEKLTKLVDDGWSVCIGDYSGIFVASATHTKYREINGRSKLGMTEAIDTMYDNLALRYQP